MTNRELATPTNSLPSGKSTFSLATLLFVLTICALLSAWFVDPEWHLTELFLNLSLIGLFCVGLFSSTRRLFAVRTTRFRLSHILQLFFAISVCLAIHHNWLKLYGWMIITLNLEFDIGMFFHRPLWRTIVIYFNLFALSFAVTAWLANICSAIRSSVSRSVG